MPDAADHLTVQVQGGERQESAFRAVGVVVAANQPGPGRGGKDSYHRLHDLTIGNLL